MHQHFGPRGSGSIFLVLLLSLTLAGCIDDGDDGNAGVAGAAGASTGTVSGTVTNSLTGGGVANAGVETDPAVAGGSTTTDATGNYTLDIPVGNYKVSCTAPDYADHSGDVSVLAGVTMDNDVALVPTAPVIVSAGSSLSGSPGGSVLPVGSYKIMDGSSVLSTVWTQTNSVDVTILGGNTLSPTVELPGLATYKDQLVHHLMEPPVTQDDLPPNVQIPEGEFPGGIPNRFMVVGLNHFALEEAGHVALMLTVNTTSGAHTSNVDIHAALPWKPTTSLPCVPILRPVLLHGEDQASYDWSMTVPVGSGAGLTDATTRNPYFTPDVPGTYEVTVTDLGTNSAVMLEIVAGTWEGSIDGQGPDGPISGDGAGQCFSCHESFLRDTFDNWAKTGHAHIFSVNLDTSTHYGEGCFDCHTVGFDTDPAVVNGGFDDAPNYAAFLGAGMINKPGNNWQTLLGLYPDVAKLGNIQCENCHGPNNSELHPNGNLGAERASLSSDVCARCHGEPLRHARFQQWQLSPHANYELAIDEGDSSNCSRCHTANGFIAWSKVNFEKDTRVTVDWEDRDVHPQTCAACHDPHKQGQTSGEPNTATVRVTGDTPLLMGGFYARDVGRGAVCMVCHNTRRGLINDQAAPVADDTAPHRGAQADMLMGQNAYFVQTGVRGKHSLITDTCANCHMEQTPPPGVLSYNGGGTNHTFRASESICSECHDSITAGEVKTSIKAEESILAQSLEAAIQAQIYAHLTAGSTVELWDRPRRDPPTLLATLDSSDTIVVDNYSQDHQDVDITVNGTKYEEFGVDDIEVNGGAFSEGGPAAQVIVKSGWNLLLVRIDGSHGIHNPTYALQILAAAQSMMNNTDFDEVPEPPIDEDPPVDEDE